MPQQSMMIVNGLLVTADRLAAARQQVLHDTTGAAAWAGLTPQQQSEAVDEAGRWLQGLQQIVSLSAWFVDH